MTRLSLDQCRNLKEWGYSQDKEGSFYWVIAARKHKDFILFIGEGDPDDWIGKEDIIACPTLEEILEWIGIRETATPKGIHLCQDWDGRGWEAIVEYADPDAGIFQASNGGIFKDTPLEAAYALCEALYANKKP